MESVYFPADVVPDLVPELLVRQLDESLDFYCRLCGFHVLYQRSEEHFAYLQREGAELMLSQADPSDRTVAARASKRSTNFQISVRDIDALYRRFDGNIEPMFLPMQEKWYAAGDMETGVKQFIVRDPDGYLLRFSQRIGSRPHRPQ